MGGDRAPQIVIDGANIIAQNNPDVYFSLFGDENKIIPIIQNCHSLKDRYTIFHTEEFISADEKPSIALRRYTKSSMRLAIDSVKDKQCDVVVSAGNTGALMAIAKVVLRPLESIDRPAIVTSIPNQRNRATVLLDMGANIDCDGDVLYQFAVMGHAFARVVLKIDNPRIGLLNVGSEELKGHEELKIASSYIKESHLKDDFYGYVEGDDIMKGTVDVVVTDGFTGNITLKTIEGSVKMITSLFKEAFTDSIFAKIGYLFCGPSITKKTKSVDPRMHNGAMLVGLNGVVVKSHGSTDRIGFANAIKVAISLLDNNINEKIIEELSIKPKRPSLEEFKE